jgi:hypothetical protein
MAVTDECEERLVVDMVRLRLSLQNRKGTRLSAEQEAQFFACFLHQASIFLSLSVGTGYISQL